MEITANIVVDIGFQAGPQRENFPGGTKVDTGPKSYWAHAVKAFFIRWL